MQGVVTCQRVLERKERGHLRNEKKEGFSEERWKVKNRTIEVSGRGRIEFVMKEFS